MGKLFQLYKSVCWALWSTTLESLSVDTASSTGGLRTTELGEITDIRQDFLKSYSPKNKTKKKVILLNQCLKIAFGKAETTEESGGFLLKQKCGFLLMLMISKRPLQNACLLLTFITLLPNPHDKLAFLLLLLFSFFEKPTL